MKTVKALLLILLPALLYGQKPVSGVVYGKEKNKETALTGVSIYWAGTSEGTTTDLNGEFSIANSKETDQLVIRFVGYRSDTIDVSEAPNPMKVVLFSRHELDEVVVKARATGTHISRIKTISTQEITGEELCRAACCNLSESFTTNASVDVSFSDAVTGAKQIQLLGLSGRYVQMQTENYPNFYGLGSSFGLEYIPGTWMESISVSKGSASVINGYQSLTGQINVEYKKPQNSEKLFLNLYTNNAQRYEFNINSSAHLSNNLSTMLLGHVTYNDHKIDHNNDDFIDLPLVHQYNVFNRWNWEPTDKYTLQVGAKYFVEDRRAGQMGYQHELASNSQEHYGLNVITNRAEVFMKHGYIFNKENETSLGWITSAVLHDQNSFFGRTHYNGDQKSIYSNLIFSSAIKKKENHEHENHIEHEEHREHEHDHEHEHEHDHDHEPKLKHHYNTGFSFKYDEYTEQLDSANFSTREVVPGAFLEYTMEIPEKLTFMAGLRADHHNEYGLFITPRSHFKYDFTESTSLRLSVGKGYRTARILAENNVLLASSRAISIADNLKMEEAWNYGISLTHYLEVFKREMTLSADFYRTDFINQIIVDLDTDVDRVSFYNLDGESYSNNYQLQMDYELIRNLDLTAAFRYTDVKSTYGGRLMKRPLTSDYKGLLTLSYATPGGGWQFDFTSQFNGGGRIPSTEGLPQQYQRPESFDPFTLFNFQATKFIKALEIYAGVENLTDYVQENPVIAADSPFGPHFDSSLIWGPIHGRKIYLGMRFSIDR